VGERTIVRDSVIGERASVASGTEVVDLAIGDDEEG
jgi:hypothetical protein